MARDAIATALRLAKAHASRRAPESLAWSWEDAILLYGFHKLRAALPNREREYVARHHAHWATRLPRIDRSDRCASALTALALLRDGNEVGRAACAAVSAYIERSPRNSIGALDHLGSSPLRALYPRSIWVDSLMMYAVFAAQFGAHTNDAALIDFAASQPIVYASRLMDRDDGLFRHAWLERFDRVVPRDAAYWLRGNGWVVTAIVEILDAIPNDHARRAELIAIFDRVAQALVRHQRDDGAWSTLINRSTYVDTSGTSLVAYALSMATRRGWIASTFEAPATRALDYVTRAIDSTRSGASMPSISSATNALPAWTYPFVPRRRDLAYGVGAYLMAASASLRVET